MTAQKKARSEGQAPKRATNRDARKISRRRPDFKPEFVKAGDIIAALARQLREEAEGGAE